MCRWNFKNGSSSGTHEIMPIGLPYKVSQFCSDMPVHSSEKERFSLMKMPTLASMVKMCALDY